MLHKSNKVIPSHSKYLSDNSLFEDDGFKIVTSGVEVKAWPEFADHSSQLLEQMNVWSYNIKITNYNNRVTKLKSRYFKIVDEDGGSKEVTGEGVIGKQPEILPNDFFEYQSSVSLKSDSAIMSGYYVMEFIGGEEFKVKVPAFSLDLPVANYMVN